LDEATVKNFTDNVKGVTSLLQALQQTPASGVTSKQMFGGQAPFVTTGPLGDSQGYSIAKMARLGLGTIDPDQCKVERDISTRLKSLYQNNGFSPRHDGPNSWLVPYAPEFIPTYLSQEAEKLALECKQKMMAGVAVNNVDWGQVEWAIQKAYTGAQRQKALGTLNDIAGGSFVPSPAFGSLIELQRNAEIFSKLGVSEIALPPQGRIQLPKQTGGGTFYMVPQARASWMAYMAGRRQGTAAHSGPQEAP
jgi:hypothetical protein